MKDIIKIPYTTRPFMIRNKGDIFSHKPNLIYLKQKQREIRTKGSDLYGVSSKAKEQNLIARMAEFCSVEITTEITRLAMCFEEDIAILHNNKLEAICFCFPSSWVPAQRLGFSLEQIHTPVADGTQLIKASNTIAQKMAENPELSFRRYVWTITTTGLLSNHPSYRLASSVHSIEDLFFRLETQTTAALGDGLTSFFFVKVDVIPLHSIWDSYGTQILESINSMSDAIVSYKNLGLVKRFLNSISGKDHKF